MKNDVDLKVKELSKEKISTDTLKGFYVYALWKESEIVYIGQTHHLESRVSTHLKTKDFDEYSYIVCDDFTEMDILESYLIVELKPKYNRSIGNGFESIAKVRSRIRVFSEYHKYSPNFYIKKIKKVAASSNIEMFNLKGVDVVKTTDVPALIDILLKEV